MAEIFLVILLLTAAAVPFWLLGDARPVPAVPRPAEPGRAVVGHRNAHRPRVSVVVPARDEEATLPALLSSLDASSLPLADVVVVDDGSRDRTAPVARAGGARVLAPGTPPSGWTGKAWACHTGAEATTGDLLLFLDADTVLAPDALAGLLMLHEQYGGLVSVQPFHRVVRPYEQLSAYFNAVALLGSGAFARRPVGRPMAFGPCLLTSRVDYDRAGGHSLVRGEILDDARLAAGYDRAGLAVHCAVGGRSVSMRSYPGGLRQLLSGWTKNIAAGASTAAARASVATVLWVAAHHAVAAGVLLYVIAASTGRAGHLVVGSAAVWGLGWLGVAWQLRTVLRRAGSFRWWTWVLFPVPLLAFDLVFARSAVLTVVRRSVRWRGRTVDLRRSGPTGEVP